jgi:hypothetical protein
MVQMLTEYSEGRASMDDVVRALVSHRGWLVPLAFAAQGAGEKFFVDGMMILSTEAQMPADELWIFTDQPAALTAQEKGALLGTYAGGVAGTELFRKINTDVKTVRVNPGSPREQTWIFLDGGGIEAAKIWADAIALEESFAEWEKTGEPDINAVKSYRGFLTFDHSSGPIITLPNQFGMTSPAVAFTAPDCAEMFLSKLAEEQRATFLRRTIDGATLLEKAPQLGIDGLIFNVFGPGVRYALPLNNLGA